MTQITTTDAAHFDEFTVRLTSVAGQDSLQISVKTHGSSEPCADITPDDLRTLAGWLQAQAAKLPPKSPPLTFPRNEVPMGGRCGSVRYWRDVNASKHDDDLRSVCTLPAGHVGEPHTGPDQTGKTWHWNAGAECNATQGNNFCTLTCGHKGEHEGQLRHWANRLSID